MSAMATEGFLAANLASIVFSCGKPNVATFSVNNSGYIDRTGGLFDG